MNKAGDEVVEALHFAVGDAVLGVADDFCRTASQGGCEGLQWLDRALPRQADPVIECSGGLFYGRLLPDGPQLIAQDIGFADRSIGSERLIEFGLLLVLAGTLPGEEVVALAFDETLVRLGGLMPRLPSDCIERGVVVGDQVELIEDDPALEPDRRSAVDARRMLGVVVTAGPTATLDGRLGDPQRTIRADPDISNAMRLRAARSHGAVTPWTCQGTTTVTMHLNLQVLAAENQTIHRPTRQVQEVLESYDLDTHAGIMWTPSACLPTCMRPK